MFWRACRVNGFRGFSFFRRASSSSRRVVRSRTISSRSFCSFLRYSWLGGAFGRLAGRGGRGWRRAAPAPESPPASARACHGRRARRADIGHLHQRSPVERHHVEILAPGERDALAVRKEAGIALGIGRPGDLLRLPGGLVVDEQVTSVGVDRQAVILAGIAECGRRQPGLLIGELAQPRAIPVDYPGVHGVGLLPGVLLPLKVDLPAVARPADLRGFVAHQAGPAHDVVDGQSEPPAGLGLEQKQGQAKGEKKFAHYLKS